MLDDVSRARRVPGGVAARFKSRAQSTGGKAAGVRLALDQFLPAEFGDCRSRAGRIDEAVMLLGGDPGHRLEEVRVVRRAMFQRPILHRRRDGVGNARIERGALANCFLQSLEYRLGKPRLRGCLVENIDPKQVLEMDLFEIDIIQFVLGSGDRMDRLITSI